MEKTFLDLETKEQKKIAEDRLTYIEKTIKIYKTTDGRKTEFLSEAIDFEIENLVVEVRKDYLSKKLSKLIHENLYKNKKYLVKITNFKKDFNTVVSTKDSNGFFYPVNGNLYIEYSDWNEIQEEMYIKYGFKVDLSFECFDW